MNKNKHFSYTATFIIIKLFGLSKDPKFSTLLGKNASKYYECIVSKLPWPLNFFKNLLKNSGIRHFAIFMEDLILPGDLMHLLMRKVYIEDAVSKALKDGYRQVVVLGSGLDFTAVRTSGLHYHSFEIDSPAMIRLKSDILKKTNYANNNLHLISAQINESGLENILTEHPDFNKDIPTIFIAEGFLVYQDLPTIQGILFDMNRLTGNNSRFIFTLFDFHRMRPINAQIIRDAVEFVGEKLKWNLGFNEFKNLLQQYDYSVKWEVDSKSMKQEKLHPLNLKNPLFKGFYIMTAESDKTD